jgi:hypothetical protein
MDDIKMEFWGDMQKVLWVENTAVAMLSNEQLTGLISTDGKKAHKPIISLPHTGTYTPYSDITFNRKTASKQTLEVDTYRYAADEVDVTDKNQTRYPLTEDSAVNQMKVLNNKIEQLVMSKISGAFNTIQGTGATTLTIDVSNILDIFEECDTKLGAIDAPFENRIAVFGPHVIATIRKTKQQRESILGDKILENGVVGPFSGYTVIQSNNLPYTATLTMATQPTALDTVTVAGVIFQFVTALVDVASTSYVAVLNGADVAAARVNFRSALIGDITAGVVGVTWAEATGSVAIHNRFTLNEKRSLSITSAEAMVLTGYGDVVVSEGLTNAGNVWSAQEQTAVMGNKGIIDLVLQIQEIESTKKEKGFAYLIKSMIGVGAYMFDDGARVAIKVRVNASAWK